eukprot:CAMPEP_0201592854 /NCGR_PEP_ID=MMETSP0190_2-20130828/190628_1 /ASSEMBLY_ACC=CAM_ASM_000263 /TAXON_ID=37353 /ORGANISM="Rosalina sp." /LENGTH=778 /DNA_ID=CAMNT_0048051797 /DNA_START=517 /DNA_END=2853 /DNA_ORIENTATION=+
MISFALYILAISITIQYTIASNPKCDGTQIIYATPPSIDPLTGEPISAGLDAITLSVDEANSVISNVIGVVSDISKLVEGAPDQQPELELIRSATINPLTTDLVLLYQEIDPADPMNPEPRQRLVIIPGFKLNSLLVQSPGILGYLIDENIDLGNTELDQEYPLTEIAFDCAGNLLGVTMMGELVHMIIAPGSSDLETYWIGPLTFQGGIVGLSAGFVGLTFDFQTNTFIAVGGIPIANTLVQFAVSECEIFQFGNPIIITDEFGLCPLGIVDIESRGDNQFYITCAIDAANFGLAILELVNGIAEILPMNAAEGIALIPLPNSSGGSLVPSIPSGVDADSGMNVNAVCFPQNIGSGVCPVRPTDADCEGDITIQLIMTPPVPMMGVNAQPAPLEPNAGGNSVVNTGPVSGTYGYGVTGAAGGAYGAAPANAGDFGSPGFAVNTAGTGIGAGAAPVGVSFNDQVIPGTAGTGAAAFAYGASGYYYGYGDDSSNEAFDIAFDAQGNSIDGDENIESVEVVDASVEGDTDTASDDDTSADSQSEDDEDDVSDDASADDEDTQSDDDEDDVTESEDLDSIDDEDDVSDDDDNPEANQSSDGESDSEDSMDGDGDESDDDDETDGSMDSVDPLQAEIDFGSAEDAQLNGNNFHRNGFLSENGYDNNGHGDGDESNDDDETDASMDSVDPFQADFELGSAEDAQLNGNNFHRNGFLSENGYDNNGQGTMISLSPSTLANLWGLAMIFLGINLTFLCICYYRNGQCQKKQVTMDHDNDGDIESL